MSSLDATDAGVLAIFLAIVPLQRSVLGARPSMIPAPALTDPLTTHFWYCLNLTGLSVNNKDTSQWQCPRCRQQGINVWHGCTKYPTSSLVPPTPGPRSAPHALFTLHTGTPPTSETTSESAKVIALRAAVAYLMSQCSSQHGFMYSKPELMDWSASRPILTLKSLLWLSLNKLL